jgi:hypothetical protein
MARLNGREKEQREEMKAFKNSQEMITLTRKNTALDHHLLGVRKANCASMRRETRESEFLWHHVILTTASRLQVLCIATETDTRLYSNSAYSIAYTAMKCYVFAVYLEKQKT